jgi:F-type H+-transporting ATPase subunit b
MDKLFSGIGIEWPVLVTQFVSFILLFVILRFVAYKPILKMLDERSRRVKESLEQAEIVKAQSARSEEEVKKQIQAASQQGQEIILRATQTSEEIRAGAQDQAKKEAELLIEKARQAINAERESAVDEIRQEFADLTVLAAGKVIGQTLDKKSHKVLIDKVLQESKTLNKG